MKAEEPKIIISLSEYNRLKEENEKLTKAFKEKATVLRVPAIPAFRCYQNEYRLLTVDNINDALIEKIKMLEEEIRNNANTIGALQSELFKKKSFWG